MDSKGLFRQAALEKLSSPERLDEAMRVTSPAAWLALIALGVMLTVLVLWGVFGTISLKVRGQGMMQSSGGIHQITAAAAGRVKEVRVKLDDEVKVGDVVALLDLSGVQVDLDNERGKLRDLQAKQPQADADARALVADLRAQERQADTQLRRIDDLYKRGAATLQQVMNDRGRVTGIKNQITSTQEALEQRQRDIDDSKGRIRKLEEQLRSGAQLRSPSNGRVCEISASPGKMLQPGEMVASIEREGEMVAILFVPAADGKKVRLGDDAQVSPSTVKREEWGSINGNVESASRAAASGERLKLLLGNDLLVQEVTKKSASSIEVAIRLTKDTMSPSGYSWTSGTGPNQRIYSGTPCEGNIKVGEKRPISYVLPIFRKGAGG